MIDLDLGDGHWLEFTRWQPDRTRNPHYASLPDVERFGAIVSHRKPDGMVCEGAITFEGAVQRLVAPKQACWRVESWDPLTLSPSLRCHCGDHGWIRDGKWILA